MNISRNNSTGLFFWQVAAFIALLLVLRIAGIFYLYFFESDEVSIAAGAAALVRNNVGDLYRYTPQFGYYRLIEFFDLAVGGDVSLIPAIMKGWSAFVGVLVPVAALFAFRSELTTRQRWLTSFVLTANPILWKSSQYGNSATAALGFVCVAVVLLSNRPRQLLESVALIVFAVAVLVRADSIVLIPLVAFLTFRNHQSIPAAALRVILLGVGLLVVYSLLLLFDPRTDNAVSAVSSHFSVGRKTMFWEYLIWAISPIPLISAVIGLSRLLDRRPLLLLTLLLWIIPPMAFYFVSTTTPRYFMLTVMPLGFATAIGIDHLVERLVFWVRPYLAWVAVLFVTFVHLLVGLGQFTPSWRSSPLYAARFRTHDGWMPSGALIYNAYYRHGFLGQSFRNPGFGQLETPHWEGLFFTRALEIMGSNARANHTTILLWDTGYGHAFHYHAQVAGADYLSRQPSKPSPPFTSETWLTLGKSRIMAIAIWSDHYAGLQQFEVTEGDQIWVMGKSLFPDQVAIDKLPSGVMLVPKESFADQVRVFEIQDGTKNN